MQRIGLISDTHGLVRPEALAALDGCVHIVHAGDIGNAAVLEALRRIAPVTAVRGNNDTGAWTDDLPLLANLRLDSVSLHALHDLADLDRAAAGAATVVVTGHSHQPSITRREGVLFINPGSAGPRRFRLPVSVALLEIDAHDAVARIVELALPAPRRSTR